MPQPRESIFESEKVYILVYVTDFKLNSNIFNIEISLHQNHTCTCRVNIINNLKIGQLILINGKKRNRCAKTSEKPYVPGKFNCCKKLFCTAHFPVFWLTIPHSKDLSCLEVSKSFLEKTINNVTFFAGIEFWVRCWSVGQRSCHGKFSQKFEKHRSNRKAAHARL